MTGDHPIFVRLRVFIYNGLFIFYIFSLFLPLPKEKLVISIGSFLALALSFALIDRLYQWIVGSAIAFSVVLLIVYDLISWDMIYYFSGLTNILVLLGYAALFAIPVHLGAFPRKLYMYFKSQVSSFRGLYATFSCTTFLLCSVMATSAIPTVRSSLYLFLRKLPDHFRKPFQSMTFVRPFILTLYFSPVAAATTVTLAGTKANAIIVMAITFPLALIFLVIDIMTARWRLQNQVTLDEALFRQEKKIPVRTKTKISLAGFICTIALFIATVLSTSHFFHFTILDSVVMLVIPYTALWSLGLKQIGKYGKRLKQRLTQEVPKLNTQVSLFVSFAFMINVIIHTKLSDAINSMVMLMQQNIGPFVLVAISLIVLVLTWVGILPQLVVVLVTQTLNLQQIGLTPEWFAVAVIGAALSGSASSPFTVNANLVALTIEETPVNVVRKNLLFSFVILIVSTVVAVFLQFVFR